MRSAHTNKAIEVYDFRSEPGGKIRQGTYDGTDNQLWRITSVGNGYYTISSKLNGLNLDVWQSSTASGGDIRQSTPSGADNQQFRFESTADNHNSNTNNPSSSSIGKVDGFAAMPGLDGLSTTTGGANGSTVTVNSCSKLQSALRNPSPMTVQIPNTTIDCRTKPRSQQVCAVQCGGSNEFTYRVPVGSLTCRDLGSNTNTTTTRNRNETRMAVESNKTVIGVGPKFTVQGGSFIIDDKQNIIFKNL